MEGYCVKCKEKREIQDAKETDELWEHKQAMEEEGKLQDLGKHYVHFKQTMFNTLHLRYFLLLFSSLIHK